MIKEKSVTVSVHHTQINKNKKKNIWKISLNVVY